MLQDHGKDGGGKSENSSHSMQYAGLRLAMLFQIKAEELPIVGERWL
jgi:hypothetical protein